jgi:hypothetical protein
MGSLTAGDALRGVRAWPGTAWRWLLLRLARWFAPVWAVRAEIGAALLLIAGWTLLTAGIAQLLHRSPWLFSAGLFAMTLFGWKYLYTIGRDGLYALTRPMKPPRG